MFRIIAVFGLCLLGLAGLSLAENFAESQQKFPRVRQARAEKESSIKQIFDSAGVAYPPAEIFIRALKFEKSLELWAKSDSADTFRLIKAYPFTAFSGTLGPKRRQGDLQIPEGVYSIDRFNPASSYHLSFSVDYPNKSDRIRKSGADPGGDIFIHGNRVTIGCIPIGNNAIKELYLIVVDAKSNGQKTIPVHMFPCRMTDSTKIDMMAGFSKDNVGLKSFWDELLPIYNHFETTHRLPDVRINADGSYEISE
ncbi:MAG: L,D-transpeptidase family protein [Candidatus Zixiibacteriota bacterium]